MLTGQPRECVYWNWYTHRYERRQWVDLGKPDPIDAVDPDAEMINSEADKKLFTGRGTQKGPSAIDIICDAIRKAGRPLTTYELVEITEYQYRYINHILNNYPSRICKFPTGIKNRMSYGIRGEDDWNNGNEGEALNNGSESEALNNGSGVQV